MVEEKSKKKIEDKVIAKRRSTKQDSKILDGSFTKLFEI